MDWSAENVLDFGPALHRRGLRWSKKSNVLWPVRAWRVVTPQLSERKLNILQRAVLRFHVAGFSSYEETGELLGVEPQLVAYVTEELKQMDLVDTREQVTINGERMLEDNLSMGDTSVGWVFQDSFTGRFLPRFVKELKIANVEAGDDGRAWVLSGSKGSPRRDPAFVVRGGNTPVIQPTPNEIIDASRRHERHGRRADRMDHDLVPTMTEKVHHVSLISEYPENYHLLTYIYVPESPEYEDEPWYVADPFGFGASPSLKEAFEKQIDNAPEGLRDLLGRMTGEYLAHQRDSWREMQTLLRSDAHEKIKGLLPMEITDRDSSIREKLELAYVDLLSAEYQHQERGDAEVNIDAAYLRLRQSIEKSLEALLEMAPPGETWRKLFEGNSLLPRNVTERIIHTCAETLGCSLPLPNAILGAAPNVKKVCLYKNSSNLRPMCAAFILAATDHDDHPFRRLIKVSPSWIQDVNQIASIAGGEVHGKYQGLDLKDLRKDVEVTVKLCCDVLTAINN